MRLLLDTHAFVWTVLRSDRLSRPVAAAIRDPDNDVFVSAAAAYEIEYKRPRDEVLERLPHDLDDIVRQLRFEWLSIEPAHTALAGRLPRVHGDPFDRIMAAQALALQATLVTKDPWIAAYGAQTLW